jgi:serine/threonine protein kinase
MVIVEQHGNALAVGSIVGDTYQVSRLLGRGGMGSVWEANHLRLPGKRVAIKVLHSDVATDQEALARFRREAEIASRLGHPNIVEVHDFNTLPGGQPYLVLELLVGESLDARIRRGPMPAEQAIRIAAQIAAGLSAAHRAEVVHRDLKPQNVFLVARDDEVGGELVKVLDFGISKIRGSQTVKTQDSTILGTPQYMAPEQATGNHASVDQRTDVFALGAIVFEMLTGGPAFNGQNIPEVVFKVVYQPAPPLAPLAPEAPPRVVRAVERALAKNQDERFPDVASFVEEMAGATISTLRRKPVVAVPATAVPVVADPLAATVNSARRSRESVVPDPPLRVTPAPSAPPPMATIAPPATETVRRTGRRGLWIGLALALLVGGGIAAVVLSNQAGGEDTTSAQVLGTQDTPTTPVAAGETSDQGAPAVPPSAGAITGKALAEVERGLEAVGDSMAMVDGVLEKVPAAPEGSAATPPPSPSKAPRAPLARGLRPAEPSDDDDDDESSDELAAAAAALAGGDHRKALEHGHRAALEGAGAEAHAVVAKANCALGNIGDAVGAFRRIPARKVRVRRSVREFCRQHRQTVID